jgi:hypothetical protein
MNRFTSAIALCALVGCGGASPPGALGSGSSTIRSDLVQALPSEGGRAPVKVTPIGDGVLAAATPGTPVEGAPTDVHGPFVVSAAQMRAMLGPPPPPAQIPLAFHEYDSFWAQYPTGTGLAAGTGCNCDPQFAASRTNGIGDCSENIAFYSLSGTPLGEPSDSQGNKPIYAFFDSLAGLMPDRYHFDNRVIYDGYRQRFWVTSMVKPNPNGVSGMGYNPYGERPKIFFAVSQTADATGGWYFYYFPAEPPSCPAPTSDDGTCNIDFEKIGISHDRFLITNRYKDPSGRGWVPYVTSLDATSGANGTGAPGTSFWNLENTDGSYASMPIPALSHNTSALGAYFVSHYGSQHLTVWSNTSGDTNPYYLNRADYPLQFDYNQFPLQNATQPAPGDPLETGPALDFASAAFRAGRLLVAWNETSIWNVVGLRVVSLDTGSQSTIYDDVLSTPGTSYSYPAVDIGDDAEVGVGFTGSSSSLNPSIMFATVTSDGSTWSSVYNAYPGTAPDDRDGTCDSGGVEAWADMASMEANPYGYHRFWIGHQFGSNTTWQYQLGVVNITDQY